MSDGQTSDESIYNTPEKPTFRPFDKGERFKMPSLEIRPIDPRITAARAALKQADVMGQGLIITPDATKISCLVEALKNVLDVLEDMR